MDFILQLPGAHVWLDKIKCWEISITNLADFLDAATFVDDIELTILPNENNEISEPPLTPEEITKFKIKPFAHQVDAVNYGLAHPKWLLLDSMGLGKTCEAIYLAETLKRRGKIDHCFVICGVDSLRQNWKAEIQRFSNLPVLVLGEKKTKAGKIKYDTLEKRAEQFMGPIDEFFIVTNITNIRDKQFMKAWKSKKRANKIDMIVFDEAHRAAQGSKQSDNLLDLSAEYLVAMTGTPIINSPLSAYVPLRWTKNDAANFSTFKSQYCQFGGFGNKQIVGYKDLDVLQDEISGCSLRRTFAEVRGDMPTKTIEYELVELDSLHRKFYEAIKDGVKEEADKIELNVKNILALTTRLRQATSSPAMLTTSPPDSSKINRIVELAEDILEAGEKVVIMSVFKEPVYQIATKLEKFRPLVCTGDQSEESVFKNIQHFRNDKDFNIVVGTHAKIGTGHSMPECQYMLMLDTPWTEAQTSQSMDRIYRITSDKPIYVKILCGEDTIDERVRELVENKKELADYLVDGLPNPKFTDALRSILRDL